MRHRTTYGYSDVVTSSYGRGYLTPRECEGQSVIEHVLSIEPDPADHSTSIDVFGNRDVYFHVRTDHTELVVEATSVVEVDCPPVADNTSLDLPWEYARPFDASRSYAVEFVLDVLPSEITPDVRRYSDSIFRPETPLRTAITELNSRIYRDFTYKSGSTTVSSDVSDVFEAKSGVCQDFARIAIACLRAQGLAGRYVSGYLATDPPPGGERMIGADATHAWAAVLAPDGSWLGFDPTNNQFVDERYITAAWGRDYVDVPPLRGIIYTESQKSTIDVAVDVIALTSDRAEV